MAFSKPLPEWQKEGSTPLPSYIQNGWGIGEFPPADWFNWQWHLTYEALKELQEKAADKNDMPEGIATEEYVDSSITSFTETTTKFARMSEYSPEVIKFEFNENSGTYSAYAGVFEEVGVPIPYHIAEHANRFGGKTPEQFLESTQFTGTPGAPTPGNGDRSTKLATTEFVMTAIDNSGGGSGGDSDTVGGYSPSISDSPETVVVRNDMGGINAASLALDTPTGVSPIFTTSQELNENFNADLLDGKHASDFLLKDTDLILNWDDGGELTPYFKAQGFLPEAAGPGVWAESLIAYQVKTQTFRSATGIEIDAGVAVTTGAVHLNMNTTDGKRRIRLGLATEETGTGANGSLLSVWGYNNDESYIGQAMTLTRDGILYTPKRINSVELLANLQVMTPKLVVSGSGSGAITTNSASLVTNLNADMLDGFHVTSLMRIDKQAGAEVVYVSPTGSDSNSGAISTSPVQTFARLIQVIRAFGKIKQVTIYLMPGTYNEELNVSDLSNVDTIFIRPSGGAGTVTLQSFYATRSNNLFMYQLAISQQIQAFSTIYAYFESITFSSSGNNGFVFGQGATAYVRDCTINNRYYAIQANDMSRVVSNNNTGTGVTYNLNAVLSSILKLSTQPGGTELAQSGGKIATTW